MRFDQPQQQRRPEDLYPLRLAWRAVEAVLEKLDLGGIAIKLNADDPSQTFGLADGTILFSEDNRGRYCVEDAAALVRVDLERARARVFVEHVDRLVRTAHLRDLDERYDLGGDELGPDVDVEVDLSDVIAQDGELLRTAPQRVLPARARPYRARRVLRALGRS